MKQYLIISVIISGIFCSCQETKVPVERYSLTLTEIISDSIESMMPGAMCLSGQYLLWTDPFSPDNFIHVLDINAGKEVGKMVRKGEGPEEFINPGMAPMANDQIFVYDQYSERCAIFSIDSCKAGTNPVIRKLTNDAKDITSLVFMENGNRIAFSPSANKPFTLPEQSHSFGKLPFDGDISSSYDHFQGMVRYNADKGYLYYSTFKIPYFALYKKNGTSFKLEKEELRTDECTIKDGNLIYMGNKRGPIEVTLTSDYIVSIDSDPKAEPVDYFKIGLDYSKLPHTICLYDYDLQLRKVIDLGMPLLRLASSTKNNTLFVLGINPDFIIYKIEL